MEVPTFLHPWAAHFMQPDDVVLWSRSEIRLPTGDRILSAENKGYFFIYDCQIFLMMQA